MTINLDQLPAVDNFDWLDAVDSHPDLSVVDKAVALDFVGVRTDLSEDQRFWGAYHLETYGFLRSEVQPRSWLARRLRRSVTVKYAPVIPDEIITDAELSALEDEYLATLGAEIE